MSKTPKEVAEWMMEELARTSYLYQETTVYDISEKFGDEFTYVNENGNLAIDKKVLSAFKKLNEGNVVWDRGEKAWRFRESFDSPGRQQD
jgi:hypothetical protein